MVIILEFQFMFSMKVCLNLIIYLFMIYANTWSLIFVNSRLILIHSSPIDQYGPLILTHSSHMVFPSRLYFFHSRTNITYINPSHTQTLYFFPIYGIRISKQHSKLTCIHDNTITKLIPLHYSDRVASATPVRFLHLRFLFLFFWRGGGGEGDAFTPGI